MAVKCRLVCTIIYQTCSHRKYKLYIVKNFDNSSEESINSLTMLIYKKNESCSCKISSIRFERTSNHNKQRDGKNKQWYSWKKVRVVCHAIIKTNVNDDQFNYLEWKNNLWGVSFNEILKKKIKIHFKKILEDIRSLKLWCNEE